MSAVLPLWPCAASCWVLQDGWAMEPEEANFRTEMDGGAVAVEPRFSRVRTVIPHVWWMKRREFEIFKGFWSRDLNRGQLWFIAPVFDGLCTKPLRVRFEGTWRAVAKGPRIIEVSAPLETADLPQASAEDQEAYAVAALVGDAQAYAAGLEEILGLLPGAAP